MTPPSTAFSPCRRRWATSRTCLWPTSTPPTPTTPWSKAWRQSPTRGQPEPPRSATDVLALTDAYSNVAIANGLINDASALVQFLQEAELTEDEALGIILSIATNYTEADFFLDAAENNLVYGFGFGQAAPPEPEVVK